MACSSGNVKAHTEIQQQVKAGGGGAGVNVSSNDENSAARARAHVPGTSGRAAGAGSSTVKPVEVFHSVAK